MIKKKIICSSRRQYSKVKRMLAESGKSSRYRAVMRENNLDEGILDAFKKKPLKLGNWEYNCLVYNGLYGQMKKYIDADSLEKIFLKNTDLIVDLLYSWAKPANDVKEEADRKYKLKETGGIISPYDILHRYSDPNRYIGIGTNGIKEDRDWIFKNNVSYKGYRSKEELKKDKKKEIIHFFKNYIMEE